MMLFDQPESDITAVVLGVLLASNSSNIVFPLKTKNGGRAVPIALPQAIIVVVPYFGLTTDFGLLEASAITLVGLCSVVTPVSSILYIRCGLS